MISLSRRCSNSSVFPGNNYVDIGEWMLQDRSVLGGVTRTEDASRFASKSEQPHDLVVVYSSNDKHWKTRQYRQEQCESFSTAATSPERPVSQMIFIRGFASPSWLSSIGSQYGVDPEFFRQHMNFLCASVERHSYSCPPLVNSSNHIIRLCVSTILNRDHLGNHQDLGKERKTQAVELGTYKLHQLGAGKVSCGDSLVREYSTLCSSFSVVEQWISIHIKKNGNGWTVIAWMDHGRPLEKSPPGPWTDHINSRAIALPVLQSHSKMAFRTTTNRLSTDENDSAQIQQSAAVLPSQYDSLLALVDLSRRAPCDPLLMCVPLFAHVAFSELQFLNLMESNIQMQIDAVIEGFAADALNTFQFFSNILERHAQHMRHGLRALRRLGRYNPSFSGAVEKMKDPRTRVAIPQSFNSATQDLHSVTEPSHSHTHDDSDGAFTAAGLLENYEDLCGRCAILIDMCTRGITLTMNKASIDESRKGIGQSERVKKLTVLATFFIPLSFCASLFGMNLDVFGQSSVKVWWFPVFCVPITLFAYVLYLWDWQAMKVFWTESRKRDLGSELVRKLRSSEKDPGWLV